MKPAIRDSGFDDFRKMALDPSLSKYEKIGFPDAYRKGQEAAIFADIQGKLTNLGTEGGKVLDIGPGCSDLPAMMIEQATDRSQQLYFIDSPEMLDLVADRDNLHKIPGAFPSTDEFIEQSRETFDAILVYSVLQYIFVEFPLHRFLDAALSLLAPKGQLLLGDIPNISKRKRFFASKTGQDFHKAFTQTDDNPDVVFNCIEFDKMDDTVLDSIVQRARLQGFDAYIVPQGPLLPMANRREDILIVRP